MINIDDFNFFKIWNKNDFTWKNRVEARGVAILKPSSICLFRGLKMKPLIDWCVENDHCFHAFRRRLFTAWTESGECKEMKRATRCSRKCERVNKKQLTILCVPFPFWRAGRGVRRSPSLLLYCFQLYLQLIMAPFQSHGTSRWWKTTAPLLVDKVSLPVKDTLVIDRVKACKASRILFFFTFPSSSFHPGHMVLGTGVEFVSPQREYECTCKPFGMSNTSQPHWFAFLVNKDK